jgi:hypothetical protein
LCYHGSTVDEGYLGFLRYLLAGIRHTCFRFKEQMKRFSLLSHRIQVDRYSIDLFNFTLMGICSDHQEKWQVVSTLGCLNEQGIIPFADIAAFLSSYHRTEAYATIITQGINLMEIKEGCIEFKLRFRNLARIVLF